jgi:hypothetical protein
MYSKGTRNTGYTVHIHVHCTVDRKVTMELRLNTLAKRKTYYLKARNMKHRVCKEDKQEKPVT